MKDEEKAVSGGRTMRFILIVMLLLLFASVACAETYKWEDGNGVHYTDNANSIPEQLRTRVIEEARQRSGYDRQVQETDRVPRDGALFGPPGKMIDKQVPAQPRRFNAAKSHSGINSLFASLAGFMTTLMLIGLAIFALWLFTLIDIIRSEFTEPSNKILWIILVIFLSPLALLLYYLIGRNQKKGWMSSEKAELSARLHREEWKDGEFRVR
jgi:hypothetical protein